MTNIDKEYLQTGCSEKFLGGNIFETIAKNEEAFVGEIVRLNEESDDCQREIGLDVLREGEEYNVIAYNVVERPDKPNLPIFLLAYDCEEEEILKERNVEVRSIKDIEGVDEQDTYALMKYMMEYMQVARGEEEFAGNTPNRVIFIDEENRVVNALFIPDDRDYSKVIDSLENVFDYE